MVKFNWIQMSYNTINICFVPSQMNSLIKEALTVVINQ